MTAVVVPSCRCLPSCDLSRHAVLRRLSNAIEEAVEAGGAVLNFGEPKGDERFGWRGIVDDVGGALWSLRIARCCVESESLPCCHSEAAHRAMLARRAAFRTAKKKTA